MVRKRATWLVILFLSEMLTATAMGRFESEIAKGRDPLHIRPARDLQRRQLRLAGLHADHPCHGSREKCTCVTGGGSCGGRSFRASHWVQYLGVIGFIRISTWALRISLLRAILAAARTDSWPGPGRDRIVGQPGRLDAAVPAAPAGHRPGDILRAFCCHPRGCIRADHLLLGRGSDIARDTSVIKKPASEPTSGRAPLLTVLAAAAALYRPLHHAYSLSHCGHDVFHAGRRCDGQHALCTASGTRIWPGVEHRAETDRGLHQPGLDVPNGCPAPLPHPSLQDLVGGYVGVGARSC